MRAEGTPIRTIEEREKCRLQFVGLDVHKPWINLAVLLPGHDTPMEWRIVNEPQAIRKMLKHVASLTPGDVQPRILCCACRP